MHTIWVQSPFPFGLILMLRTVLIWLRMCSFAALCVNLLNFHLIWIYFQDFPKLMVLICNFCDVWGFWLLIADSICKMVSLCHWDDVRTVLWWYSDPISGILFFFWCSNSPYFGFLSWICISVSWLLSMLWFIVNHSEWFICLWPIFCWWISNAIDWYHCAFKTSAVKIRWPVKTTVQTKQRKENTDKRAQNYGQNDTDKRAQMIITDKKNWNRANWATVLHPLLPFKWVKGQAQHIEEAKELVRVVIVAVH